MKLSPGMFLEKKQDNIHIMYQVCDKDEQSLLFETSKPQQGHFSGMELFPKRFTYYKFYAPKWCKALPIINIARLQLKYTVAPIYLCYLLKQQDVTHMDS